MKRWLSDCVDTAARVIFNERIWAVCFAVADRFVTPHLERARGRASLWLVRDVPPSVRARGRIHIIAPDRLTLGEYVRIGRGCFFHCLGGLTIGDNTQISRDVVIYTANHDYEGGAIPYDANHREKPVVIGRSVWIGMCACITPGVTIGDGAVVGMGAVIAKDVPSGSVVVGAPQRVVSARNHAHFRELDAKQQWFGRLWPDH